MGGKLYLKEIEPFIKETFFMTDCGDEKHSGTIALKISKNRFICL
jgi:hypothetical protein